MQMPRHQGRWPARVIVALLIVITALAITWREQFGHFLRMAVAKAHEPAVRQGAWEDVRIGTKAPSRGDCMLAVALEEGDSLAGKVAPTGLGCDEVAEEAEEVVQFAATEAEPAPRVASRIDPLLDLPRPEWGGPPRPPSLADVQAEEQAAAEAAQRVIETEALRSATAPAAAPTAAWPQPTALLAQLAALNGDPHTSTWRAEVESAISRLTACPTLADPTAGEALAELRRQFEYAQGELRELPYSSGVSQGLRVNYSLERRLAVWEQARAIALGEADAPSLDAEQLAARIEAVRHLLTQHGPPEGWSEYLLLEELAAMPADADQPAKQRELAARAVRRMEAQDLSPSQLAMLAQPPIVALASTLRGWAVEPADVSEVLATIETFEALPSSSHAAALAQAGAACQASHRDDVAELGNRIETHWRNANLRVSISGEFMNLFMPQVEPVREAVRDRILGAAVRGQSASSTELRVILYPDPSRIYLGLAAEGDIESRTRSSRGPVTLYSDGYGSYIAEKIVIVDTEGVSVYGAASDAHCQSRLRGIDSTFDHVPLMGSMVRNLARQEHDEQRGVVRREFERRVESRAERRFDEEVNGQLAQIDQQYQERVLGPLQELQLEPTAIDMHTTAERAIMRTRLAGVDQLSAHTPRPAPLDDSLLNVQIHESAINNAVEQLGLDGRRSDLRELYAELAARLGDESGEIPEDLPERVTLELAAEDAVRIACEDGRVMIELRVRELSRGRSSWEDFAVRAYYEPVIDGLHCELVRVSGIELEADGLRIGDKLALRGIFTKVFSRNQTLQLVPDELIERPAMVGVVVTQFRIEDGWVGASLGYSSTEPPVVAEAAAGETR